MWVHCQQHEMEDYTHIQPFYGPFSWTTQVSHCQKKYSSGLYGAGEDIRGRHSDNLAGCHSIRINQRHPPPSSPHFNAGCPSCHNLPIYPGLGQAPNMLACIPNGLEDYSFQNLTILSSLMLEMQANSELIAKCTDIRYQRQTHRINV